MGSSEAKTSKHVEVALTYDDEILLGTIALKSHLDALLAFAQELSLVPAILKQAPVE